MLRCEWEFVVEERNEAQAAGYGAFAGFAPALSQSRDLD
jgi:hypothetical protein